METLRKIAEVLSCGKFSDDGFGFPETAAMNVIPYSVAKNFSTMIPG
jgi:hypothetical protein